MGGSFPFAKTRTSLRRADWALSASVAGVHLRATWRCSGRRPEGPAAVPLRKDKAALTTSKEVNVRCGVSVEGEGGKGLGAGGCLSCISLMDASLYSAMPREVRDWIALVNCPSDALVAHLLTFFCSWFRISLLFLLLPRGRLLCFSTASLQRAPHSRFCQRRSLSLIRSTRDEGSVAFGPWPAGRTHLQKINNFTHSLTSPGISATCCHRLVTTLVNSDLTAFGGHL